jgi:hypothetical protein
MICGKAATAEKIFETVLSNDRRLETIILWASFARMQWLTNSAERVIEVVCRASGDVRKATYSGLDILRTKQHFDDLFASQFASNPLILRALARLRFLLELTTGSVESMLSSYDSHIGRIRELQEKSYDLEEIVLSEIFTLLRHHINQPRNSFPRSAIRRRIADAIRRYPNNTLFLGFFLECERGEGVWGRVRRLIGEAQNVSVHDTREFSSTKLQKSVGRKIWDIWVVTRWLGTQTLSDEAHRLRRLFSKWSEESRYTFLCLCGNSMCLWGPASVLVLSSGDYGSNLNCV